MENIQKLFAALATKTNIQLHSKAFAIINEQLRLAEDSLEHPIYHPERFLIRHIDIVVGRAMETENINLWFVALFHDITKHGYCEPIWIGRRGETKTIYEGTYYQNIYHAEQAGDFLLIEPIQRLIESSGGNLDKIHRMVVNHMKMKNYLSGEKGIKGGMGESKRNAFKQSLERDNVFGDLYHFSSYCDNMLTPNKQL